MAQNDGSTAKGFDHQLPCPEQEPPPYGILTRTLIHSPVVKQIIPARIRSRDFNDVVFVGEAYIELYLLGDDGKLQKVATKADFQADIRHARVFATTNGVEGNASILSDDVMAEDRKNLLPPHILVLTLDSGHIGFLYAVTKGEEIEFVLSTRKIDGMGVHPRNLGKSLSVDPKSRCLAVTAYQDTFRMFALFEPAQLERQLQVGWPLNPIREEKTFCNVPGVILHMEFLHPAPNDPDYVILVLFIVDAKQKFRLILYEWWASKPLSSAARYAQNGLRLPDDVSMPLHLIPLLVGTAFLLISEFCIHAVRASDIVSGNAPTTIEFPQVPPDGGRQSLVTSWARPPRTPSHTQTMDDLYLAMEDGDIYFVEVGLHGPNLVQLVNKASHLNCAIGSAFAALDYGLERDDLLVAGGEMSSGGVYLLSIGPSFPVTWKPVDDEAKLEGTVANWSPVFDFDLINLSGQGYVPGRASRDRMYACTGRGEHGAVVEIRYGIQGEIQSSAEYLPGIRNVWVLPDAEGLGFFLLCSFPDRSTLCFLNHLGEWEDVSEDELLDMQQTTIAATAVGERSVQITPKAINVNILRGELLNKKSGVGGDITMSDGDAAEDADNCTNGRRTMWSRQCGAQEHIVAAAICDHYLVIAVRTEASVKMDFALLLPELETDGTMLKQIGIHIELREDPSFVSIMELSAQRFAIVGTREATLQFFLIDKSNGLIPTLELSLLPGSDVEDVSIQRDFFICESAVLIKSSESAQLLCGLRDGTLMMFRASLFGDNILLERINTIKFGPIPVRAITHVQQENIVLVLAGSELYRFKMSGDEVNVSQIVFEGTMIEPVLSAVYQIDSAPNPGTLIIGATKNQIFYAEIGNSEKVCVRRLPVLETPRRLLYYKPLNLLIVAISKTILLGATDNTRSGTQRQGSSASLCLLEPRTGELLGDKELMDSLVSIFGKINEQIYGLIEWNVEVEAKEGSKIYRYVAISTGFTNVSAQQMPRGRVIIISVIPDASGRIEVRRRHQIHCDAPVYSVAPYGKRSIVYCMGNKLCMKKLNVGAKKLEEIAEFTLRSPAVQITVNEPYINCSCASDSLCVIKFEEGATPEPSQLLSHYSDEIARSGFSHYSPLDNLFIVSDKQCGIAGLWQPPDKRNTGSLTTLFDTETTSCISRLRGGLLRPPWYAGKSRPGVLLPEKDIIGSGVDGSIFHLTLLNVEALRLLKYIQGTFITQAEIHRHHLSVRNSDDARLRADVDADSLFSVLRLGEKWLTEAVRSQELEGAFGRGGVSLAEMVEQLLGPLEGGDPVVRALDYVKDLLNGAVL